MPQLWLVTRISGIDAREGCLRDHPWSSGPCIRLPSRLPPRRCDDRPCFLGVTLLNGGVALRGEIVFGAALGRRTVAHSDEHGDGPPARLLQVFPDGAKAPIWRGLIPLGVIWGVSADLGRLG